ncbi:Zn-ribbon domain-containing OB-fold protein [Tomitella biformata]|uniref:Zn-ribbon domain-containing OB-fold protein n=1 Tax=Tomitella biformata TaxID=630403 RepID=UPI0004648FF2|nr:OB-fold domain-containing protein [Tomitella biformata]
MSIQPPAIPFADLAPGREVIASAPDGTARLIGARCAKCDTAWFPRSEVCPACATAEPARHPIGPGGTLYSYSTVHVSSARETPYTIGFVDFDEGVRVLGTIDVTAGLPELDTRCELRVDADNHWWFTPEEKK